VKDIILSESFCFNEYVKQFGYVNVIKESMSHYFAYMIKGRCRIVTNTYEVHINEGDVFYIPNGLKYESHWEPNGEIRFLSFGFSYLPNFDNKNYPSQVIHCDEDCVKLIKSIPVNKKLTAADIGSFYTMVGKIIPFMKSENLCRTQEIVAGAKKELLKNPRLTAAEMSKKLSICESALYAAFARSSELSLLKFKQKLLFERAKELLITTDKSIEQISEMLNFSSCGYFRKGFKNQFGVTPREMRKQQII